MDDILQFAQLSTWAIDWLCRIRIYDTGPREGSWKRLVDNHFPWILVYVDKRNAKRKSRPVCCKCVLSCAYAIDMICLLFARHGGKRRVSNARWILAYWATFWTLMSALTRVIRWRASMRCEVCLTRVWIEIGEFHFLFCFGVIA